MRGGEVVAFLMATTTVTVMRGTTTDEYGDEADNNAVPIASGVPIALTEQDGRTFVPAEQRTTRVRRYVARAKPDSGIRPNDRLRDEVDGVVYLVEAVVEPSLPIGRALLRLDLRRVE
jgi:hypothetical protein